MSPFQRRAAQLSAALVVTVAGCKGKQIPPPPEPVEEPAPTGSGGIQSKVSVEVKREGDVCIKYTSIECWDASDTEGPREPIPCNPPPPKPVPCPPDL